MSNKKKKNQSSSAGLLGGLLAVVLVLILGVGVAAYALGWMSVSSEGETTTIEVDRGEFEEAAAEAGRQGREFVESSGEALQEAGENLERSGEELEETTDDEVDPSVVD